MARKYDRDTILAYVEEIRAGRMTVIAVAKELDCAKTTVYSWLRKLDEDGEHGLPGSGRMIPDTEYQNRLERENKQLRNEVEFLKRAAAYFAGDQKKGTR